MGAKVMWSLAIDAMLLRCGCVAPSDRAVITNFSLLIPPPSCPALPFPKS